MEEHNVNLVYVRIDKCVELTSALLEVCADCHFRLDIEAARKADISK